MILILYIKIYFSRCKQWNVAIPSQFWICEVGQYIFVLVWTSRPERLIFRKMSSPVVIAGIVVNILSVVGIVITNKYITEVDGFHFMVFLSFLHFAFTTIGTRVMLMMGLFSYQPAPLSGILPVAAGSLLSVAFMNLNLSYKSVGFYQVITTLNRQQLLYISHCNQSVIYNWFLSIIVVEIGMHSIHTVSAIRGVQAIST